MKTWNITPTSSPSLAQAQQSAQPGDLIVLSGNWKNTSIVPKVSGSQGAPITYKAGPAGASFDGPGPSGMVALSGRVYVVLDGIGFANSAAATAPAINKGVILRGARACVVQNCKMSDTQMQLIGASDNQILDNRFRRFVARYDANGQPQTAGDVLGLMSGSHRNEVGRNDMKYGGHSLIQVGNGWGPPNAANWIHDNILDNPWYKPLILADDGGGTIVEKNKLLNTSSMPTLQATVLPTPKSWPQDGKSYAQPAVQLDGKNYTFRNNLIDNATSLYGTISMGSRWYYGQGAPAGGTLVEPKNNQAYGNKIQNCNGPATFSFEQNYTPGKDLSVPDITGNLVHDNEIVNPQPSRYSWNGGLKYETILFRSFKGAPVWDGLNGNQFFHNLGFSLDGSYRRSYVDAAGKTVTQVYTLAQLEALDPADIYGNVV